jgi:hypothetical protein
LALLLLASGRMVLTFDPPVHEATATASDASSDDLFGHAVAVSGQLAVVGAYANDTTDGNNAGVAYVFSRNGNGTWTEEAVLRAFGAAANDQFGRSVAISGGTIVVGAPLNDGTEGTDIGSVYVFTRVQGVWTERRRISAPEPRDSDEFGASVAIDGTTLVVGVPRRDVTTSGGTEDNAGSAYVFTGSGSSWTQEARLVAESPVADDQFGRAVSVSGDRVAVGAPYFDWATGPDGGAVDVFTRQSGTWTHRERLGGIVARDGDQFGTAVSIDRDALVVGAPFHDHEDVSNTGGAWVFRGDTNSNSWPREQKLVPAGPASQDRFGTAVAISGNGVVVGAPLNDLVTGADVGAAHVFTFRNGQWDEDPRLSATNPTDSHQFGTTVAIDRGRVVVGNPFADVGANGGNAGTVDFYELPDTTAPTVRATVSGQEGTNGWYTADVTVEWIVDDLESEFTKNGCASQQVTQDTDGQTFTCTAESRGGSRSESITIKRDATRSTLNSPNTITATATSADGAVVTFTASAGDATSGVTNAGVQCVEPSGSTFPIGTTSHVCWVTDRAGNVREQDFTVTVTDSCTVVASGGGGAWGTVRHRLANPSCAAIDFAPDVTRINLDEQLVVSHDVAITGPGANVLTIDGRGNGRVLRNPGSTVTVSGVTMTGGLADQGGAIHHADGDLTLHDVAIVDNTGTSLGGGIYATGTNGTVTITGSTINGNTSENGGAIFMDSGALLLLNSTVANNVGTARGGGIRLSNHAANRIVFSTIAGNTAGSAGSGAAGLSNGDGLVKIRNTIVAGNSPVNCPPGLTITASGRNYSNDSTCSGFTQTADPLVQPLADNTGPTQTMALMPASPALDTAPNCNDLSGQAVTHDQRGISRPRQDACDVGAFESRQPLDMEKVTPTVTATGGTFTYTAEPHAGSCTVTGVNGTTLTGGSLSYSPGGATAPVGAGSYTVTCTRSEDANHLAATASKPLLITAATPLVSANGGEFVFTGDPQGSCSVLGIGGVTLSRAVSHTNSAGQTLPDRPAAIGTYTVRCVATDPNYLPLVATTEVMIFAPPVLDVRSMSMETRRWTSPVPTSGLGAVSIYNALPLGLAGYAPGPIGLTLFQNVNNAIVFGGANNNMATHYRVVIDVPREGPLDIRVGTDMGRAGALLINGDVLQFRDNDMYVGQTNWADPNQFLAGSVTLSAGTHVIEVYGFENCCDGPGKAEFSYFGSAYAPFESPANDVPVVAVSGPSPVSYTSTQTYAFTVTDDGESFSVMQASCGVRGDLAGAIALTPEGGTFTCAFHTTGVSQVTVQVDDDRGARSSIAAQSVSVVDMPPTFTAPANQTAEATGPAGAVVTFTATGNDVEDGAISAVCAPVSGSTFPLGTTAVNCIVTDSAGSTTSGAFTVTVVDTTAPVIAATANVTMTATSAAGAVVTYAAPATSDLVAGVGVATCAPASGATFGLGVTTVTCLAVDGSGNTSASAFSVTVTPACTVINEASTGWGSLRERLANPSCPVVDFAPEVSHIVLDGELVFGHSVAVNGPGAGQLSIDGNGAGRVFQNSGHTVALSGMTITGGLTSSPGAGISTVGGTLTLTDAVVSQNTTTGGNGQGHGGGIYVNGSALALTRVVVAANHANFHGGGVYVTGASSVISLTHTTVSDNTVQVGAGGGVYMRTGTTTIRASSIVGNQSNNGAGISASDGQLTVTNSTVVLNRARSFGGAFQLFNVAGTTHISHSTVAANSAGNNFGGFYFPSTATAIVKNSIVAGNGPINCGPNMVSVGQNFSDDATCGGFTQTGTPLLEPLADNGGPTPTMALTPGSPAIDAVAVCTDLLGALVSVDQRGTARPQGASCDAGAFEATFDVLSISMETRRWPLGPIPASAADSIAIYSALPVGLAGYAPTPKGLTSLADVNNANVFGGVNSGIGSHYRVVVSAPVSGPLAIRVGLDFHRGAVLLVDGQVLDFRNTDMYSPHFTNPAEYLAGTTNLTAGTHVIEIYGFEQCCDGPGNVQFSYLGSPYQVFQAPANDVPVVSVTGSSPVSYTSTQTYSFTVTDDGDSYSVVQASCGIGGDLVGSLALTPVGGTFTCAFHTPGVSQVTVQVDDDRGARSNMAALAVSLLNAPPTFTAPANQTVEATGAAGAAATFTATGADVEDGAIAAVCAPASGTTFALGTTTVNCTVTDSAGATATGTFDVTVVDTTAPVIAATADITVAATSAAGAAVTYTAPATSDLVDGAAVATCAPASGSTFALGTTTVTCAATDAANHTASSNFTVTVTNNAPTFTAPANQTEEAASAAGAVVTFTATGNDVEDGAIAAVCAPASGTTFALGTTTVNCTVTDSAGATATGTFDVTVVDTTAPAIVYSGNAGTYEVSDTVNITCAATDAVGVTSSTCANVGGPATGFLVGANTVTSTATDAAGNSTTASVTFTVIVTSTGLQDLITEIAGSSAAQLVSAVQSIAAAPNANARTGRVNSFRNQVNAQLKSGKITAEQAALLNTLVGSMN